MVWDFRSDAVPEVRTYLCEVDELREDETRMLTPKLLFLIFAGMARELAIRFAPGILIVGFILWKLL